MSATGRWRYDRYDRYQTGRGHKQPLTTGCFQAVKSNAMLESRRLREGFVRVDDFEYAAAHARLRQKAALHALVDDIQAHESSVTMDEALHLAIRSFQLDASSASFAERIWARSITEEKAAAALRAQFHEFPEGVVDRALYEATVGTR